MKIQCDVCGKDEAAVFCSADEAALCGGCDYRVHHANKLASKHQRFSLLSPSSKDSPLCDICQERRAFLFCQQDRAILCRECDVPIHTANEHTLTHNRFLLTGVKLSATSNLYASSAKPTASLGFDTVPDIRAESSSVQKRPVSASSSSSQQMPPPPPPPPPNSTNAAASVASPAVFPTNKEGNSNNNSLPVAANPGNGLTSSISEYLTEMLPGWHFEDFLDSCSASFGFCKSGDDMMNSSLTSESLGIWVPQAPNPVSSAATNGLKEAAATTRQPVTVKHNNRNSYSKRWSDDIFAVPQISPTSSASKRPRHFH